MPAPYFVKARRSNQPSGSRFAFVSGTGTTYLRVHATRWNDREAAEANCKWLRESNPDYVFKVVGTPPVNAKLKEHEHGMAEG